MDADDVVAAAGALLQRTLGWRVAEAGAGVALEGSRRSVVKRVAVEGVNAPRSVIIKAYCSASRSDAFEAFLNEAAAADFLGSTEALARFGPRLLAADPEMPLVVLEDLGPHPSLADALLGTDRQRATAGLLEWARSLGALHVATLGARQQFELRRSRLAGRHPLPPPEAGPSAELGETVNSLCALGILSPPGVDKDVVAVVSLHEAGELDAFTPSDSCPDNNAFTPAGLRFFDFEGAGFRHAFLDAAYMWIGFPTCWCVNRLPPPLVQDMQDAYLGELAPAAPEVYDNGFFSERMTRACAWWVLLTTGWLLPRLLERDAPVGPPRRQPATRRQCVVYRLELFTALAEEWDCLPALSALITGASRELRRRWPPEDCDLPVYPPFR